MAGLVPATHAFVRRHPASKTWMPATSAGHDDGEPDAITCCADHRKRAICAQPRNRIGRSGVVLRIRHCGERGEDHAQFRFICARIGAHRRVRGDWQLAAPQAPFRSVPPRSRPLRRRPPRTLRCRETSSPSAIAPTRPPLPPAPRAPPTCGRITRLPARPLVRRSARSMVERRDIATAHPRAALAPTPSSPARRISINSLSSAAGRVRCGASL